MFEGADDGAHKSVVGPTATPLSWGRNVRKRDLRLRLFLFAAPV